jgi:hypothetical protein
VRLVQKLLSWTCVVDSKVVVGVRLGGRAREKAVISEVDQPRFAVGKFPTTAVDAKDIVGVDGGSCGG